MGGSGAPLFWGGLGVVEERGGLCAREADEEFISLGQGAFLFS